MAELKNLLAIIKLGGYFHVASLYNALVLTITIIFRNRLTHGLTVKTLEPVAYFDRVHL